eukprot:9491321-Pyramimonas_sp.AAC.3
MGVWEGGIVSCELLPPRRPPGTNPRNSHVVTRPRLDQSSKYKLQVVFLPYRHRYTASSPLHQTSS